MCRINAICHSFKDIPNALNILQLRVFWHYDIMSEFTNVNKGFTNVYLMWKNSVRKIFLYGDKCVYAYTNIYHSVK